MKTNVFKVLLLTLSITSCSRNDDRTIIEPIPENCLNSNLQITAEYANPFPNEESEWLIYSDWEWTMKDDNTLCVSFEEVLIGSEPIQSRYCLYYSIDTITNCPTLVDAKIITDGETTVIIDGIVTLPMWNFFDTVTSSELQEFDLNDKIIGEVTHILTYPGGNEIVKTYQFWIELTEENHYEFTELELNSGL